MASPVQKSNVCFKRHPLIISSQGLIQVAEGRYCLPPGPRPYRTGEVAANFSYSSIQRLKLDVQHLLGQLRQLLMIRVA